MDELEQQKQRAAVRAVAHIRSGMTVGLGTGSTAKYATLELGQRLAAGELAYISAVATSQASEALAQRLLIPLVELSGSGVDVAIDGIDEVTETLDAIKGLGGALTREKMVESRARTFIVVGDERKLVTQLGERTPVPVEVLRFGWRATLADLSSLGCKVIPRQGAGGDLFETDNGHIVLDCHFSRPLQTHRLDAELATIPGVIEHGLFLGMATHAYIATASEVLEFTR
ncbi:MAG: ribose 5-phosphate isomerase A [Deinococcota bacterium]|jgi:ribose 5-phosphate isomerase A|nr:ribose 5-phosphate isomerase A [Deinococcota bacterium]